MLYESLLEFPRGRDSHDLLRQQSENEDLKSKNRSYRRFPAIFLDFLIFRIFDDFGLPRLSISTPWLNFLPRTASKSTGH